MFLARQRRSFCDTDQLLVYNLLDTQIREFLAISGMLDAAKRKVRSADGRIIDENHACVDLACEALAVFDVLRVDRVRPGLPCKEKR